jgi:hypothetical protein
MRRRQALSYLMVTALFMGIFCLSSTPLFVQVYQEGGFYWTEGNFVTITREVNSTQPIVDINIATVRLVIPHFNVSAGNVSIDILNGSDIVVFSLSEVSGINIVGTYYPVAEPVPQDMMQEFVVRFYWEGENTTVTFQYLEYWGVTIDYMPEAIAMPGFTELFFAGLLLLCVSGALFLSLSMTSNATETSTIESVLLLITGLGLPVFIRWKTWGDLLGWGLYSSAWYYYFSDRLILTSYVGLVPIAPESFDIYWLVSLAVNAVLCIGLLLYRSGRVSKQVTTALFFMSLIPALIVVFADLLPLADQYGRITIYMPLPILQVGALALLNRWGKNRRLETEPDTP